MQANVIPVQSVGPMRTDYFKPGYPILSFLFGLYCDPAWSDEAFQKWDSTGYEYEGYLDPYLNMPHGVRQIITEDVPGTRQADVRVNPTPDLVDKFWPYFVQELTFPAPAGSTAARSPAFFNVDRPVLSTLGLIFLNGVQPTSELQAALAAKYPAVTASVLDQALNGIFSLRSQPASLGSLLDIIRAALSLEMVSPRTVW